MATVLAPAHLEDKGTEGGGKVEAVWRLWPGRGVAPSLVDRGGAFSYYPAAFRPPVRACAEAPDRRSSGGRHGLAEVAGPDSGLFRSRRPGLRGLPLRALDEPGRHPRTDRRPPSGTVA